MLKYFQYLDEYAATVDGFNRSEVPRLEWQREEGPSNRFYIRVPMFLPHHGRGPRPPAAAWLHPWVKAAHARSRAYRANPDRPRVRGIEKGVFRDISTCEPPTLQYGDVVGIVFTVTYAETPSSWSPIYMMSDIIRVAHANREFYPLPATDELVGEQPDGGEYSVAGVDSSEQAASHLIYHSHLCCSQQSFPFQSLRIKLLHRTPECKRSPLMVSRLNALLLK